MSKTLGSIVTLAGAVVVNVVPGLGQLASAAILIGSAAAGSIIAGLDRGPKPETTRQSIKSPTPARVSAYGRVRLYWAWILYETASDGWAVDVGVFHAGEIDAIEAYYIGDKQVTVLAGGWIQKGPAGEWGNGDTVRVGTRLGLSTETAFSEVIAKLPGIWTSNHRGDGCVTGFMLSKNVKVENFQTIYSLGGPNNAQLNLVVRAQKVFDWRDETQSVSDPTTWKWSENVWLHIAHYELVRDNKDWAKYFVPTLALWTAAANDADSAIPLKAGGTEPRYRSCLSHKHTDAHKDVLGALLACCDGWLTTRSDGALVPYSGAYYAPTVTIGPDEIISYSLQHGVNEEDAANTLKVTYVSADHDFSTVDTDDWTDEDDISARGKVLSGDPLENPVPSHGQGRRLAKRKMAEIMAPQRGVTVTNAAGRIAVGQRYVRQQIVEAGIEFQDAVVQIKKLTRNPQTGGCTYEWVMADANVDAWNPATEEGDPAPVGDRVAREPLEAPVVVSVTPNYSQNTAYGVAGVKLTIIAEGPARDDLTWFVRTREAGLGVSWLEQRYPDADPGSSATLQTDFLPLAELDVEVAYSTGDGGLSPWASAGDAIDTGAVLPDALSGLSVTSNADGSLVVADWSASRFATSYLVELIVE